MIGIQATPQSTKNMMKSLPTIKSSLSLASLRRVFHRSSVKMIDAELNIDVREERRAAIMTAAMNPLAPMKQ